MADAHPETGQIYRRGMEQRRENHENTAVKIALAFPDVYEVAMSHLGLKIIYSVINKRPDALAERVYAPWVDMEALMKEKGLPLYTLESRVPVRDLTSSVLLCPMKCVIPMC